MKKATDASPNRALKRERELRCWSQLEVADRIGTTAFNVSRWERGITFPGSYFRQQLCTIFEKSPQELNFLDGNEMSEPGTTDEMSIEALAIGATGEEGGDNASSSIPLVVPQLVAEEMVLALWNVPYRRNLFFTGRDTTLQRLYTTLHTHAQGETQVLAISGLGGIGKTQTALEYVYRYRNDYQAILWGRADTRELLIADFASVAELLNFPERNDQDQNNAVRAVKRWLSRQTGWLLVLDNANDLEMVSDFLPEASSGHILLTTRAHSTGQISQRLSMEKLSLEEGALFLLRRSKLFPDATSFDTTSSYWSQATNIAEIMDGLPLALDQAAAYIEETGCGLSGYIERYQKRRLSLLRRRGGLRPEHPESLAATWSLSFEKIEQEHPIAAELLQLSAFLHPDAIAEEIFIQGASELTPHLALLASDPFEMDAAIEALITFSLLHRDPDAHILALHRLVQVVLREQMSAEIQHLWAERAVQVVDRAFPIVKFTNWSDCQRCLPHAQVCAELIGQLHIVLPAAASLLNKTGLYLLGRAQYDEAERLLTQALALSEEMQAIDEIMLADSLNNLGLLAHEQGKYARSEALLQRALFIYEQTYGIEHITVAQCISSLAENYRVQARHSQMEAHVKQALAIREKVLGGEHPDVAKSLNQLATLYHGLGKYSLAEPLYRRALDIRQQALGPEHIDVAENLNNLASLYDSLGKYALAEPLYRRALAFCEKNLGMQHRHTASSLANLAEIYRAQGEYTQAEQLHTQALEIREKILGPDHPYTGRSLNWLAEIYLIQQKYFEAETIALRGLENWERILGPEHHFVATGLDTLARLYQAQQRVASAEPLAQRALNIYQTIQENNSQYVASSLNTVAEIAYAQKDYTRVEELLQRALTIQEEVLGAEHPETARSLYNLGVLYAALGQSTRSENYLVRSLTIRQQTLLPRHPDLLAVLEQYEKLLSQIDHKKSLFMSEKHSATAHSLL
jgi:tetratricopeptide (TPR) repeat protein/transcriptional regulator with XRE-family HTH domain